MSDDLIVTGDGPAVRDSISETITVQLSADITPSRYAKIMRQVSNVLHALLANSMRYAAIGDGRNAGAGFQIHQQTYTAAANVDAAAKALEDGQRQVFDGSRMPPPPMGPGRA
jgi:hypothetical protein